MEHISHVGDIGGVEVAHVEIGEAGAAREHSIHSGDIGGVEATQIESGKGGAISEHIIHVGDAAGVEVGDACDGGERTHSAEPLVAVSGPGVGEAAVERHTGDISRPSGISGQDIDRALS